MHNRCQPVAPGFRIDTTRMTLPRRTPRRNGSMLIIAICLAVFCFVGGFFAGREHLKYEARRELEAMAYKFFGIDDHEKFNVGIYELMERLEDRRDNAKP